MLNGGLKTESRRGIRLAPNAWPWFETRGCAALLTMRICKGARLHTADLILRSACRARLEGWQRAPGAKAPRTRRWPAARACRCAGRASPDRIHGFRRAG